MAGLLDYSTPWLDTHSTRINWIGIWWLYCMIKNEVGVVSQRLAGLADVSEIWPSQSCVGARWSTTWWLTIWRQHSFSTKANPAPHPAMVQICQSKARARVIHVYIWRTRAQNLPSLRLYYVRTRLELNDEKLWSHAQIDDHWHQTSINHNMLYKVKAVSKSNVYNTDTL